MAMFLTKVWRWQEPVGPLVFNTQGARETAEKNLAANPDALVVLAATKTKGADDDDKGRLLGLLKPTLNRVRSVDFDLNVRAEDFDEGGHYRWPYGLHLEAAWRIPAEFAPLLAEIAERRFSMAAATGIVELTPSEEAKVRALPLIVAPILQPRPGTGPGGTGSKKGAPAPSDKRVRLMHMRMEAAATYAMRIAGRDAYKIGWAVNPKARARQFNLAALPSLGGISYQLVLTHHWSRARDAFRMEQELLGRFNAKRLAENQEIVTGVSWKDLQTEWTMAISIVQKRIFAEKKGAPRT